MSQIEKLFNKEQQQVIEASGGCHLVLAPPGCGKTAVLAERVVWARRRGLAYRQMACLTFTNRASRGMRERIWQRMGTDEPDLDELFVGNVHRFCSQFLFKGGVLPEQASVIDTDMSISIIADYLGEDELQVVADAKHRQRYSHIINLQHLMYQCARHYPGSLMVHRDALEPRLLRELCLAFGLPYSQESAIRLYEQSSAYREETVMMSSDARHLLTALYAARRYEEYKLRNDLVDFEDLLLFTYDAMTESLSGDGNGSAVAEWQRYDWIQVDEVQDLNPLQLAIIDLFTSPSATVVYLGDSQQAIFSFMGAQTDTLQQLRERCGSEGFHNFYQNYRSPQYLLSVFNDYGEQQLGIARELLPTTQNLTPRKPGDLVLMDCATNIDEVNEVARCVTRLYNEHPQETTAVVVAFNSDADEVSAALGSLPHFKISGVDLFTTPGVRMLLAHISVLSSELDYLAWAQLLTGLRLFSTNSGSRQFVHAMMEQAVAPTDLLLYEGSAYVAEFVRTWEQNDLVVFDTETTGLSVFRDDVVQIAAVRVRQGEVVGRLNLFVETDRALPEMLGDEPNPLIEEYKQHEHLSHAEALRRFVTFAEGAVILGHNATYDYQILEHNMRRYAPDLSMHDLWPDYLDSLKLARLLRPRLKSYKLKSLLDELGLEGQNSHLADDDIMATLSLVSYCYGRGREVVGRQLEFVGRHRRVAERMRSLYGPLYAHGREALYQDGRPKALAEELSYAYRYLLEQERVGEIAKLSYIIRYLEIDLLTADSGASLAEQLSRHAVDLATMKEADLCGAESMQERVFVSTVHKAKGLEFDNVIVFDAVEGKFPSIYADTRSRDDEEARKFYVAISRARRRLIVSYCLQSINRWGRRFQKSLTPYMQSIRQHFD
jgi:DNA helicase-2/ATP-dependent DNA helicase PcrA